MLNDDHLLISSEFEGEGSEEPLRVYLRCLLKLFEVVLLVRRVLVDDEDVFSYKKTMRKRKKR